MSTTTLQQDTTQPVMLRVYAEYQMFGDMAADEWAPAVLEEAKQKGYIKDYFYWGWAPAAYGVQIVKLSVDLAGPNESREAQALFAATIINQHVVHDTDVEVILIQDIK